MKKILIVTAAAALLAVMSIDEASARFRGGGVGGFRGVGVGGFRGVGVGGFRGMPIRAAAIGGLGYRGARLGWGGYGFAGRRLAWAGRGYPYYRYGYRRWGWPLAAGIGLAAASSYYYNSCWQYDGWQWVNVCYSPYGYYGNGYQYY